MVLMMASHQRAGSSNLARFIRHACGIKLPLEPFNWRMLTENAPGWQDDERLLMQHVNIRLDEIDAFKHIYGQHPAPFDVALFRHSKVSRILFLHRSNTKAAALSAVIARKQGGFNIGAGENVGHIDTEAVVAEGQQIQAKIDAAWDAARAAGKPLESLTYEEIFAPSPAERKLALRRILKRLGLDAPKFERAFALYAAPDKKVNRAENYSKIENLSEIESVVRLSL